MGQARYAKWRTGASLMRDLLHDDQFYNSPWLSGMQLPALNVKDNGATYEIELAAPEFNKRDFRILIDQGFLTVSGQTRHETEGEDEKGDDKRTARAYTSFSRSFNLPPNTNEEDVEAKYEEGILKLSIAKKVHTGSDQKIIEIK